MTTKFQKLLEKADACVEARDWVGTKSFVEAYETCDNLGHLLWFVDKPGVLDDRRWRLLACAFARTALPFAGESAPVCLATIEVAERFAAGEATRAELSAAYSAAYSAANSAVWIAARTDHCNIIRQHVSCREVYDGYKANYPEMFT